MNLQDEISVIVSLLSIEETRRELLNDSEFSEMLINKYVNYKKNEIMERLA